MIAENIYFSIQAFLLRSMSRETKWFWSISLTRIFRPQQQKLISKHRTHTVNIGAKHQSLCRNHNRSYLLLTNQTGIVQYTASGVMSASDHYPLKTNLQFTMSGRVLRPLQKMEALTIPHKRRGKLPTASISWL